MAKKYICLECSCTFNEPGCFSEPRDGGHEEFDCCPICESRDYKEQKEYVKDKIEECLNSLCGEPYEIAYELFKNEEI